MGGVELPPAESTLPTDPENWVALAGLLKLGGVIST